MYTEWGGGSLGKGLLLHLMDPRGVHLLPPGLGKLRKGDLWGEKSQAEVLGNQQCVRGPVVFWETRLLGGWM